MQRNTTYRRHKGSPYSFVCAPRWAPDPLWDTWGQSVNPYKLWGNIHNLIGGFQVIATNATSLRKSPQLNWRSQETHNTTLSGLELQEPKSKSYSLSPHQFAEDNSNQCTYCNGKNTRNAQILHSQMPPKQLMLWRDMIERTMEEINKWIQDLDPIASSHKEGRLIGGNIDLDLLSVFP
jgi:hypothetical protein